MDLMYISGIILCAGMALGFFAVVFAIVYQKMEYKAEKNSQLAGETGYFNVIARIRAFGVILLYLSAFLVLLGLAMIAIAYKVLP